MSVEGGISAIRPTIPDFLADDLPNLVVHIGWGHIGDNSYKIRLTICSCQGSRVLDLSQLQIQKL